MFVAEYKMLSSKIRRLRTSMIFPPEAEGIAVSSYGLSTFNRIYTIQRQWEPMVLEWDSLKKSFSSDGISARKYWPAFVNIYFVCIVEIILCGAVLKSYSKVDPAVAVSTLFMTCWILFSVALETLTVKYFTICKTNVDRFHSIIKEMCSDAETTEPRFVPPLRGPFHSNCAPAFWKKMVIAVVLVQVGLMCFIIALPAVGVYTKIDTFHVAIPMWFPIFSESSILLDFVCYLLCLIATNEVCRLFAFYIPNIAYIIEFKYAILIQLSQFSPSNPEKFIKWYLIFQVWVKLFESYMDHLLGILMGGGFITIIVSNVGTLKYYRMLPFAAYLVNPFASLATLFITLFCLPFTVYIRELSQNIIFNHKTYFRLHMSEVVGVKRKFIDKKLSCLKPIAIQCGNFYTMKRGAESAFLFYVLLRTADLLLTMKQLGIFS